MKNLFLSGPIGSGKSTSIANALGEQLGKAGGFLTVRQRDASGQAVAFWLQRPDGSGGQQIIRSVDNRYTMHPEVFASFGVELLKEADQHPFVILDEIGGFELLSDEFLAALMALLQSDVPCIGVMKGKGPANKMIRNLGLGELYAQRAESLRGWMRRDSHTLLYECGQFDPEGLRLAREWVGKYGK